MPRALTPPAAPQVKALVGSTAAPENKRRQIICFSGKAFYSLAQLRKTENPKIRRANRHALRRLGHGGTCCLTSTDAGRRGGWELDEQIKAGERTFRSVSEEMWGPLNIRFEDGFTAMARELEIDADFHAFHICCVAEEIPFNVVSAGAPAPAPPRARRLSRRGVLGPHWYRGERCRDQRRWLRLATAREVDVLFAPRGLPTRFNPRANPWRRLSGNSSVRRSPASLRRRPGFCLLPTPEQAGGAAAAATAVAA